MKYSTKALTVQAMQYLGDENWRAFQNFMLIRYQDSPPVVLFLQTPNGQIKLTPRDWVIRDEHGDYWPLTQSAFNAIFTDANDIHPVNRGPQHGVVTATERNINQPDLDTIRNDMNKDLFIDGVPDYDAGL